MLQAADVVVRNAAKSSSLPSMSLYKPSYLFLPDWQQAHLWHAQCSAVSFPDFLNVEMPIPPSRCISINAQFLNTMGQFDYSLRDQASSYIARQSLASVICFWKATRNSTRRRSLRSTQLPLENILADNDTLALKAKSSRQVYFVWWFWCSAEPREAIFRNEVFIAALEEVELAKKGKEWR